MNHSSNETFSGPDTGTVHGVARLARWSLAHRWIVVAAWVVLALAGGMAAAQSGHRLSVAFDLPGQPGYETNTAIVREFGSGGDNPPLVVVVRLPPGTTVDSPGVKGQLAAAFGRAAAALPGARSASWTSTGDRAFVSADGRTAFQLLYPVPDFASSDPYAAALPRLTRAVAGLRVDGAPVLVTGASILSSGGSGGSSSVLAETLLAGAGALVVLAVVFGSLVAITPLLIATVAIPSAFVFIYALTYAITVSTLVQNIVALVGLGVAIDYALLIVTRWREERGRGLDNRAAVLRASATAGSSVLFSGITVAVSLAALALTSVPFLRSIGLAAMLIPLISIAVSATLLPVVLDAAGPALEWPRRQPARTLSPLWTAIARRVTARPGWSAAGALAILAVLIAPVFSLNLGEPQATATAATATASARAGLDALVTSGIGPGVLRPAEILLPAGRAVPAPGGPITVVSPGRLDPGRPAHRERLVASRSLESGGQGRAGRDQGGRRRGARRPDRRLARPGRRLHHRPVRPEPGRHHRRHRGRHVRPAGPGPAVAVAAGQGPAAEPGLAGRRVRRPGLHLAARPRHHHSVLQPGYRRHHALGAAGRIRAAVRPVHGLRGVHPDPHQRGVRTGRRRPRRPSSAASATPDGSSPPAR